MVAPSRMSQPSMPKATSSSDSSASGYNPGLRTRSNHLQRRTPLHLNQDQQDVPSVNSGRSVNEDIDEGDSEGRSPVSDSPQEYDFDRDETVDTSIDGYEDESPSTKTPAHLEREDTVTPDEAGVGATIQNVFGLTNKAAKQNAESPTGGHKVPSPLAPGASKAWYEFDLAVVIALVSPIGNWLTGGDHVKKLVLITLVVYYLHQIIEIPWDLYHKARPRKRGLPPTFESENSRFKHLAQGELRQLEILFLLLSVASPFLGAVLLRHATSAVLGEDSISWFSTGLFILATGLRPWRHLVDRLSERTSELQDFVHYPELYNPPQQETPAVQREDLDELQEHISRLEKMLRKAKKDFLHRNDEVVEYVDGAGRKNDRKYGKYEMRLTALESTVKDLQTRGIRGRRNPNHGPPPLLLQLKQTVEETIGWVLEASYPMSSSTHRLKAKSAPLATIREEDDLDAVGIEPSRSSRAQPSPRSAVFRFFRRVSILPVHFIKVASSRIFRILSLPLRIAYRMAVARY